MANFDLKDCDRVLRIKCLNGQFDPAMIIKFLEVLGVQAEVLSDVVEIQNKMDGVKTRSFHSFVLQLD